DLALGAAHRARQLGLQLVDAGQGARGGAGHGVALGAGAGVDDGGVRLGAGRLAGTERLHGDGRDAGGADGADTQSERPAGDDIEHDGGSPFLFAPPRSGGFGGARSRCSGVVTIASASPLGGLSWKGPSFRALQADLMGGG